MFQWANTLILKVTRDCNLRCEYCYIKNKHNYKGELISFDTFKLLIKRIISDKLKAQVRETISFVFHGGEPLLLSNNDFSKMLNYAQSEFNHNNIPHSFGLQTNLTLLDEERCILLNKYNVSVGISFDGIGTGNDTRSKSFNQERFEEKFKLLDRFNIDYNFISVINKSNVSTIQESINYAKENYNNIGMKINYAEDVAEEHQLELDGENFWEKVWKPLLIDYIHYGTDKKPKLDDNLQRTVREYLIDALLFRSRTKKGTCGVNICGGGINIIELNPDGSLYFCGRYAEDDEKVHIGDLKERDFLSLHQLKRFTDFAIDKHQVLLDIGCDNCYASSICDFGCVAFHYAKYDKSGIKDYLVCPIFKNMYKWLTEHQIELLRAFFEYNKNDKGETYIPLGYDNKTIIKFKETSRLVKDVENIYGILPTYEIGNKETFSHIKIKRVKQR